MSRLWSRRLAAAVRRLFHVKARPLQDDFAAHYELIKAGVVADRRALQSQGLLPGIPKDPCLPSCRCANCKRWLELGARESSVYRIRRGISADVFVDLEVEAEPMIPDAAFPEPWFVAWDDGVRH